MTTNVIPTELDVYKPERWLDDALFRPEARSAFHGLIAQGWTDARRTLHPKEEIYTFWDYFRNAGSNAGLRIDHLLLNLVMADRLAATNVDRYVRGWDKASDHAPVWIESRKVMKKKTYAAKTQTGYAFVGLARRTAQGRGPYVSAQGSRACLANAGLYPSRFRRYAASIGIILRGDLWQR